MFTNIPLIINLGESGPLTWDMAKQIIQSQHNLAMWGITILVGLAVLLVAGSWIWSLLLRRHELQKAIESLKREITTKIKEDFAKLTERFKDEVAKMKKEIEKRVEERMTRFDKTVEERMMLFDAEKARLFAIAAYQMKKYETTVVWFAEAIEGYAKTGTEDILRTSVDALNANLAACKKLSERSKQEIKKCLPFIPEVLKKEKKQIEDKLKKLPEETKEH